MTQDVANQTLALAAMFQAANEMHQWAHYGRGNQNDDETLLESLFQFEPHNTLEVYGHVFQLQNGLTELQKYLQQRSIKLDENAREVLRYVISMMFLERRVGRNGQMMQNISEQLQQIRESQQAFQQLPATTFHRIAGLYQESIGTIQPRVMVKGDQNVLSNPENAARIRALLFSGVRAAFLWRQNGGRRWRLFWFRKHYESACQDWLKSV